MPIILDGTSLVPNKDPNYVATENTLDSTDTTDASSVDTS